MSPADLRAYLDVFRNAGVMSAELVTNGSTLRVVLGPEMPAPVGEPLDKERPPGEWKKWAGENAE